tara:strand:- start:565 stop:759 length:195 start_codon:yes stop_codon:yes gene_type:complete
MDPEVQALIAVYQKRLADMTAQAIAYEARIIRLQQQVEEQQAPPPESTTKTRKASAKSQDGGKF